MSDIAIRCEGLGKRYRIGQRERYKALRDSLANAMRSPFDRLRAALRGSESQNDDGNKTIWALRDISFDVKRGEVVGVIGRNGAGKSTLLRILSRITKPTEGQARVHGRVGSLLEVGTGFHPELTGRENVYLNGAILGMRKTEIGRKFDEIVAFAEVEQFIDTPVKHYSSGMYMRLAFAVAAHLEPEILLVDEVLAVGDATYQRRCINHMSKLATAGGTVLFVSHNLDLIPRLCGRALLLDSGGLRTEGRAGPVVEQYLAEYVNEGSTDDLTGKPRTGDGRARFTALRHVSERGDPLLTHASGRDLVLQIEVTAQCRITDVALAVVLKSISGTHLITGWTREVDFPVDLHPGAQTFQCCFRRVNLRPGHRVSVMLWMDARSVMDSVEDAKVIEVTDSETTGNLSTETYQGIIVCDYTWTRVGGGFHEQEFSDALRGSS